MMTLRRCLYCAHPISPTARKNKVFCRKRCCQAHNGHDTRAALKQYRVALRRRETLASMDDFFFSQRVRFGRALGQIEKVYTARLDNPPSPLNQDHEVTVRGRC